MMDMCTSLGRMQCEDHDDVDNGVMTIMVTMMVIAVKITTMLVAPMVMTAIRIEIMMTPLLIMMMIIMIMMLTMKTISYLYQNQCNEVQIVQAAKSG